MISLTRLNGATVAINPDLIMWIDFTPDTTVSLFGGEKIIVRESLDEIVERVVAFRRQVGPMTVHPHFTPSAEALLSSVRRAGRNSERPSARPSSSSIRPLGPNIVNRK